VEHQHHQWPSGEEFPVESRTGTPRTRNPTAQKLRDDPIASDRIPLASPKTTP